MPHEFLIPDYVPDFACKLGACRSACCEGWPISFTMDDYFRLLGVPCSPELRRRLDGSMQLALHPTPQEYAQITPRYDGQCPMRMEDGRCLLHAELGEGALSAVCRLYPRGVREENGAYECSCANSCEAVPELLLSREAPLTFIRRELPIEPPPAPPREFFFETADRPLAIRLFLIARMQDRRYPLPRRLLVLGEALRALDDALTAHDGARIARLLAGDAPLPAPEAPEPGDAQLAFGLRIAARMLTLMDERSASIRDYGEQALAYFSPDEGALARYADAAARFAALIPGWATWFEHLLVNHMFFVQFPYQDRPVSLRDEFIALCAVYVLLRFLCVGWTAEHPAQSAAVDVAAAAFRLIDHTEFDRYAAPILKELGCDDPATLSGLLCL